MAATATREDPALIDGYDGMGAPALYAEFRSRSQEDLTAIDAYERAHEDRAPVLDKLRYLRTREPVEGYDALGAEEILARLKDVDAGTLLTARGYEMRLRHRPEVLGGIERIRTAGRGPAPDTGTVDATDSGSGVGPGRRLLLNVTAGGLIVLVTALVVFAVFVTAIVVLSAVAPNALN